MVPHWYFKVGHYQLGLFHPRFSKTNINISPFAAAASYMFGFRM